MGGTSASSALQSLVFAPELSSTTTSTGADLSQLSSRALSRTASLACQQVEEASGANTARYGIKMSSKVSNGKHSSTERLQRSRERNRMHARKTRQRKKEHMQTMQSRADDLKEDQLRIRQIINEKNTASILVGLFSVGDKMSDDATEDPQVEILLRRSIEEIPDAAKIPELPALILPGQHNSNRKKCSAEILMDDLTQSTQSPLREGLLPDDGIDYKLLGKERSKCTPAELDQIRRERNRMHAKRTRDRKRMFMDEMEEMIKQLEDENALLQSHLESIDGQSSSTATPPPVMVSPKMMPTIPPQLKTRSLNDEDVVVPALRFAAALPSQGTAAPLPSQGTAAPLPSQGTAAPLRETPKQRKQLVTQLTSLLMAAGAFEQQQHTANSNVMSSAITAVSTSTDASGNSSCSDDHHHHTAKRQRLGGVGGEGPIPQSITTTCL